MFVEYKKVKAWTDRHAKGDPMIWMVVILLSLLGILVVYSAISSLAYKRMIKGNGGDSSTEYYLVKHSLLVTGGLVLMWFAHKIDYRYYAKLARLALIVSVPLLIYTYFFGSSANNASRWIVIPVINQGFQPSDLAKLALISSVAGMLAKRQHNIDDLKDGVIPVLGWCGVICGCIALTNFSTAIMLFMTCMLLLFIGRVPMRYLAGLVIIGMLVGTVAFFVGQRGRTLVARIERYLDPSEVEPQAEQGFIAIANGGTFGLGPGNSMQKDFLPEAFSDMIYAVIIEEYGMVGGVFVLGLYLLLLYRGMVAAQNSKNAFGGLLSAGLSFSLAIQAMVNMAVAVGLFPITGQTLPLLSMGGTSLLFTGLSFGIILSVSRGEIDESINLPEKPRFANQKK
ncbi:cell division protein FtsW [Flexibacter flexilis DSM 6793]|uniref:Probable peptidoglycan glycosyltransferase FtsW n=1 Tax=Flexibacter flexilis DSM 6793 TaxID=927664 RepID=A0A1I1M3K2_9BACT|nr:FtsW/RodA/SpoVE family cell cycle protein [Flexibacter flexilis]SFC79951.1 cell division protein FtsW [Flexibacter flexilis DSM 6793]